MGLSLSVASAANLPTEHCPLGCLQLVDIKHIFFLEFIHIHSTTIMTTSSTLITMLYIVLVLYYVSFIPAFPMLTLVLNSLVSPSLVLHCVLAMYIQIVRATERYVVDPRASDAIGSDPPIELCDSFNFDN